MASMFWTSAIVFVSLVSFGKCEKIDGKIDMVIVTPAEYDEKRMNLFKESLRNLPNYVEIGEDKVRVTVVQPQPILELSLTGDTNYFEQWRNGWQVKVGMFPDFGNTFKLIRESVFDHSKKERAKVVILYLGHYHNGDQPTVDEEGLKLLTSGAFVYVFYSSHVPSQKEAAQIYASHRDAMIGVTSKNDDPFWSEAIKKLADLVPVINVDLCTFCRFHDPKRESCRRSHFPSTKTDFFGDDNFRCQSINPPRLPECKMQECEDECNRQWPWTSNCTVNCGSVDRNPVDKPPKGMENCQPVYQCNPCPGRVKRMQPTQTTKPTKSKELEKPAKSKELESWEIFLISFAVIVSVGLSCFFCQLIYKCLRVF